MSMLIETGGQAAAERPRQASARRRANPTMTTIHPVPVAAPIPEIADGSDAAGEERGANPILATTTDVPLAPLIDRLTELQRTRQFCITAQSMNDRKCEAFIARRLGYKADQDEAARKAVWKQASDIRKAVEKGEDGEGQSNCGNHGKFALSVFAEIIRNSAASRNIWDNLRKQTEGEMRKAARSLPCYEWAKGVAGFGDLSLAVILAETGALSNYATKERVWKRLGLAVIDGERQRRKSGAEAAAEHAYSPRRRAEIWAITDSLFRHQWRGQKDGVPAHARGHYGEVYAHRKAHTTTRNDPDWTPKRRDNDARRIMSKFLVENLWRVWNGKRPLEPDEFSVPHESIDNERL
jgi:hypothetical protein